MSEPHFQSRSIYSEESPPRRVVMVTHAESDRLREFVASVRRSFEKVIVPILSFLNRLTVGQNRKVRLLKTLGLLAAVGVALLLLLWVMLPNIDDPATLFAPQSTAILDRSGIELYRLFSDQDRTYVPSAQISNELKKATIAIEDERFFDRGCFDAIGFTRAALSQFFPGFLVRSGGSTLTQQFAKNALVGRQRSLVRKVRELMLACKLEHRYDKDQLLELYLNWIPYGQNAYGIEQAARSYFGVSASELTLPQAAILAAMTQRPSYFSPYGKNLRTAVSDAARSSLAAGTITSADQLKSGDIRIGLIGTRIGSGSASVYVGGRTDQVLRNMLDQLMISQAEYEDALAKTARIIFSPARENIRAPHFDLMIESQVKELLVADDAVLEQGGFQITTTLDWNLQQVAEKVMASHREDVLRRFGAHNAALIALRPGTREVLAYVGNTDYGDDEHEGKIDMVRSPRQPGSSFKLFTYAAAFEAGFGPATVIYDVATKFGDDEPQNFDGAFWGLTSIRSALGGSRNIPAIKGFFLAGGEEKVLDTARRMGITTPGKQREEMRGKTPDYSYGWPLAIGAAEVPLAEMIQGYATVADQGVFRPMVTILKITDRAGNIRYRHTPESGQEVIDARIAAELTSILSDVSVRPNEYWQSILSVPGFATAAKTGTSNKCLERDTTGVCKLRRPESTWTLGYTPNLIAGVWVGNATSQSLYEKADGLTTAAPIWHDFMAGAHRKLEAPKTAFVEPTGLSQPLVSRLSGQLASTCTPVELRSSDLFLKERTPTLDDPACVLLKVDKVTGLLASPTCPADAVEERAFFIPRSEAPDRWPLWEQAVAEWAVEQMERWNANDTHSGSQLPLPLAPTQECDPALTPGRFDKPIVDILFPRPGDRVSYPSFIPSIEIGGTSAIAHVQYFVDDKPLRDMTAAPWNQNLRAPRSVDRAGVHTFKVVVTDTFFNTASGEVSFTFE